MTFSVLHLWLGISRPFGAGVTHVRHDGTFVPLLLQRNAPPRRHGDKNYHLQQTIFNPHWYAEILRKKNEKKNSNREIDPNHICHLQMLDSSMKLESQTQGKSRRDLKSSS
jgi:hypothetical protein